jgi:hypothetical protein
MTRRDLANKAHPPRLTRGEFAHTKFAVPEYAEALADRMCHLLFPFLPPCHEVSHAGPAKYKSYVDSY